MVQGWEALWWWWGEGTEQRREEKRHEEKSREEGRRKIRRLTRGKCDLELKGDIPHPFLMLAIKYDSDP